MLRDGRHGIVDLSAARHCRGSTCHAAESPPSELVDGQSHTLVESDRGSVRLLIAFVLVRTGRLPVGRLEGGELQHGAAPALGGGGVLGGDADRVRVVLVELAEDACAHFVEPRVVRHLFWAYTTLVSFLPK